MAKGTSATVMGTSATGLPRRVLAPARAAATRRHRARRAIPAESAREVLTATTTTPNLDEIFEDERLVCGGRTVPIRSHVDSDSGEVEVIVDASELDELEDLELHWAVQGPEGSEWSLAPESIRPENSRDFGDGKALRSLPDSGSDKVFRIKIPSAASEESGITAVVGILVSGESWLHSEDGKGDLAIPTRPRDPNANTVAERAASEESNNIGLFRRYQAASEVLEEARAGPRGAGALLAWMRLSATRQLPWYSEGNYQGKDMAFLQKSFAERVTSTCADESLDALTRHLFRLTMATLPRGGGNGDDIRMGILNILRTHGIKEGHRPGIEDVFLGQWHQKLHSSTTVDDIAICEAYLHFLHTGTWDDFWEHLWHNSGLSRENLAQMKVGWRNESGITGPANHMPHMIDDFRHLLWILKVTHGGGDLDTAMTMARGHLPQDLAWEIDDLLQNREAWWVPGKIVEIRARLADQWKNPGCPRDVLLLDICLELYLRTQIERMDLGAMADDDVCAVLELALKSGAISSDDPGLRHALHLWQRVLGEENRWSEEWGAVAMAALEYVALSLGDLMDSLTACTQPAADAIGEAGSVSQSYLTNFGEEIVRGHFLFVVSAMFNRVQGPIKQAAGCATSWTIVSTGKSAPVAGEAWTQDLSEIQGLTLDLEGANPKILLSENLGGLEDIPQGIAAVLTRSPIDILSHIAIRARNTRIFLASCDSDEEWASVAQSAPEDKAVRIRIDQSTGSVSLSDAEASDLAESAPQTDPKTASERSLQIQRPVESSAWVLEPSAYSRSVVGGKSHNLVSLAAMSAEIDGVTTPKSVSLPFGTFERALAAPENDQVAARLNEAVKRLENSEAPEGARSELAEIRALVGGLRSPSDLSRALESATGEGGSLAGEGADLWPAVKRVWGSKWTERAWLSRRAAAIAEEDLSMAVLVMDLVPAQYAFVLHTANPITSNSNQVFGEIVVGLGEALVGNDPGKALTFLYDKISGNVDILNLPSKPKAYLAACHEEGDPNGIESGALIARSDSNGEDLETFAGAGLYDSVCTRQAIAAKVDYSREPLLWDRDFQVDLATRLAKIGVAIEAAQGAPQDVEGALANQEVYLLQARNQIL